MADEFLEIPLRSDLLAYEFSITLQDVNYVFEIAWNDRAGLWTWSIKNENDEHLISGIPLFLGSLLTYSHRRAELPPGDFFLWDTSGQHKEVGQTDLGTRVVMLYKEK